MRLTLINFFKDTVPGHIFRGKRRLVKQVTKKSMNKLMAEYEMQERNMQLLKNPFITREQSHGHTSSLGKAEQKLQFWLSNPIKPPFKPHVKIEDRLVHLRVKEVWD